MKRNTKISIAVAAAMVLSLTAAIGVRITRTSPEAGEDVISAKDIIGMNEIEQRYQKYVSEYAVKKENPYPIEDYEFTEWMAYDATIQLYNDAVKAVDALSEVYDFVKKPDSDKNSVNGLTDEENQEIALLIRSFRSALRLQWDSALMTNYGNWEENPGDREALFLAMLDELDIYIQKIKLEEKEAQLQNAQKTPVPEPDPIDDMPV